MESELLACPECGSEIFTTMVAEQKIDFHVSTHYLTLVTSKGGSSDARHIHLNNIHCGLCPWSGNARDLVISGN
ncbi:MAG: hypothetical protein KQH63_13945 [Desulfobulbaceae bacterium]|nr:hypothetical protein [Desulfobulbaceae bacterium]